MAKTVEQCRAELLNTITTGLLELAAQAQARIAELEDQVKALQAVIDAKTHE